MIGNSPGQAVKPGSTGRAMPGYRIELSEEGEICLDLAERPTGLMVGYAGAGHGDALRSGRYHTGDVAVRDEEGYFTYVGRTDDVFKASDYRISPFELESLLLRHPAVAEAAVVPSADVLRSFVPKAFVVLAEGYAPGRETAREIFGFVRSTFAPYQRIRRLEFGPLPKTISGKIRRAELRVRDAVVEYREEDFRDG
jgi:acetyl-CoA synthetase